jgi:ActR/RegA family two-component response regulator
VENDSTRLSEPGRAVLIAEPDPAEQARLARLFRRAGHRVIGASTIDASRSLLKEFSVDVALVAEELTLPSPMMTIADLVSIRPEARFVVLAESESGGSGIRAPREEAIEYSPRPLEPEALSVLLAS